MNIDYTNGVDRKEASVPLWIKRKKRSLLISQADCWVYMEKRA